MKLEFVDDNVYAVFAKYVQLNGQGRVLEMVYKIREELLLEAYGRTTFMEYVNSYNQQFYQDVLTGAYNRRFYEEQAKTDHIYNGVVMIDGNHFKQINDQFGHAARRRGPAHRGPDGAGLHPLHRPAGALWRGRVYPPAGQHPL